MSSRKTFTAQVQPGSDRQLTFRISTGDLDRDNDRIDPAGWDVSAYLRNPVVLFGHDYRSLPVAKAVRLRADDTGLFAVAEFATHQFAQDVFDLYVGGFLSAVSVGFIPLQSISNEAGGQDILRAELLEFSCVPVPANASALLVAAAKGMRTVYVSETAASNEEMRRAFAELLAPFMPIVYELAPGVEMTDAELVAWADREAPVIVERAVQHAFSKHTGRVPDYA